VASKPGDDLDRRREDRLKPNLQEKKMSKKKTKKKEYDSPAIVEYGSLAELTAGGSASAQEQSQGQDKRP
jgi:hypothetical protein